MDLKALYSLYLQHRLVSTDSRNVPAGSVFFALKGDKFNGNAFALQALEKGAIASVVDEDVAGDSDRVIRVKNVLETLQDLARYHRQQSGFKVLAITGSNGKTTTKELCKAVLSQKYKVYATQGNLNNHIGVPLTLLSIGNEIEVGIIEMGANHPGEIKMLADIAEPDCGLITNAGKAHLEGFGGLEGVARAKGELFNHLIQHNKTLFLNEGSPLLPPLVASNYQHVVRYNGNTGWRLTKAESDPFLNLNVTDGTKELTIHTKLAGRYNAENVLAAVCVGQFFNISDQSIKNGIESYEPKNNRSQLISTAHNTVFMDAYNANPSSMAAAISEFLNIEGSNKILVLGEMREVGESSAGEHREIIDMLKASGSSRVICVGKSFEPFAEKAGFLYFNTVDDLTDVLKKEPLTGHFVFVKGSRSNNLEKVLPLL
ncbi:MAG TPA: UDP-N-acetylmuramoyl-tripeptide--D-alanyl-D-alanine ligase [Bacteroidales bacterium]|nr:UDP-N-acetylmuramoyl-tripeptide--D-alanyl-D-alanine ligase [Bacteroidales bacterium]